MARRGRGGQGNKGRGRRNKGPGKKRKKRVSRKRKNRVNRKPRKISKQTRRKISSDRRKKRLSKIKNKSLKNRIKSLGLSKKKTDTKKKRKRFSSLRDAFSKVKKGFTIGGKAYANAAKNVTKSFKGAAAHATGTNTKPKSKLKRQVSNFKKRWQAMSTPEAKKKRRYDRLRNQHGLDYSRMREGMTIKANVGQALNMAHKIPGTNIKVKVPKSWVKRVPQNIKNIKFNHTLRSPTKLGPRDGWSRGQYNSTGKGRFPRDIPMRDMMMRPEDWERQKQRQQMGPQQDWLSQLYTSHNINRGKLDQTARDYWTNEAKTKGRDAVMQSIIGTSKAQGTYGGRKKPRRINAGGTTRLVPLPWFGGRGHGYPSKEKRERERAKRRGGGTLGAAARSAGIGLLGSVTKARRNNKAIKQRNRAAQRQYQYDNKAYNMKKRRMAKSLAAIMSARGM